MQDNEIWIVVATESSGARILANVEGTSRLVKRFAMPACVPVEAEQKVVYLGDTRRPTAMLARQIMAFLIDGMRRDAFEGLVIVASPEMRRDLRLVMERRVSDLVIAEMLENNNAAPAIAAVRSAAP